MSSSQITGPPSSPQHAGGHPAPQGGRAPAAVHCTTHSTSAWCELHAPQRTKRFRCEGQKRKVHTVRAYLRALSQSGVRCRRRQGTVRWRQGCCRVRRATARQQRQTQQVACLLPAVMPRLPHSKSLPVRCRLALCVSSCAHTSVVGWSVFTCLGQTQSTPPAKREGEPALQGRDTKTADSRQTAHMTT